MTKDGLDLLEDGQIVVSPVLLLVVSVNLESLLAAEVLVRVSAGLVAAQDAFFDSPEHEQLLEDAVHVTCSSGVFETHETLRWSRSNGREELPLRQDLVPRVEHLTEHARHLGQVAWTACAQRHQEVEGGRGDALGLAHGVDHAVVVADVSARVVNNPQLAGGKDPVLHKLPDQT